MEARRQHLSSHAPSIAILHIVAAIRHNLSDFLVDAEQHMTRVYKHEIVIINRLVHSPMEQPGSYQSSFAVLNIFSYVNSDKITSKKLGFAFRSSNSLTISMCPCKLAQC